MSDLSKTAERRFFSWCSIVILVIVFLGFSQSFYLRPFFPDNPASSYTLVYIHGTIFSLWVILFYLQVRLIGKGNFQVHRKLGILGGLLAIVLVIQGLDLSISAVRIGRVDERFGGALPFILPIGDLTMFSTFVILGFVTRMKAISHKRWMLFATLNLINAAIGRLPGTTKMGPVMPLLIFALFFIAVALWDYKSTRKVHPVTLIAGIGSIISLPARFIFSETAVWKNFESWIIICK